MRADRVPAAGRRRAARQKPIAPDQLELAVEGLDGTPASLLDGILDVLELHVVDAAQTAQHVLDVEDVGPRGYAEVAAPGGQ